MRKITIQDICAEAQVSPAAVSRVINNKPGVHHVKRERILSVINQLGFTPNAAARGLRKNTTETIGVIVPTFESLVFAGFLTGAEEVIFHHNYYMFALTTQAANLSMKANVEKCLQLVDEKRVDGIILLDNIRDLRDQYGWRKYSIPIVSVYQHRKGMHSVVVDDFSGAYEATKHLIDHGYRDIATLTGPNICHDARERLRGYEAALRDHNMPYEPKNVVQGSFTRSRSLKAFLHAYRTRTWPEAVFAANDEMAMALIQFMRSQSDPKIRSTAIIGFDDVEWAEAEGLTSVRVDVHEIGRSAARMLFEQIAHGRNQHVCHEFVRPQLMVRNTCGCPAPR